MHEERVSKWLETMRELPYSLDILPSPPDPRDYTEPVVATMHLPKRASLPTYKILNQYQTPYCAGASGAGTAGGFYKKHFSMTYLYWLAKRYDGIPDRPGTYLRTICKVMNKYGCGLEEDMPFTDTKPEIRGHETARKYRVKRYYRLRTIHEIKTALAFGQYVLLATFVTKDNWMRSDGWISKPSGHLYGGHATYLYGYDDNLTQGKYKGYFIGANSWGERWGSGGRYFLPYDYFNYSLPDGRGKFIEAWGIEFTEHRENPWLNYRDLIRAKRRLWNDSLR